MIGLSTTGWWLYHTLLNQSLSNWCQTKKQDKEMIIENCNAYSLKMVSFPSMDKHSTTIQVFDAKQKLGLFPFFCTSKFSVQCHFSYYTKKKKSHFSYDILDLKYHWMETRKRKDHSMADWMLQLSKTEIQEQQIFWWNKQCTLCVSWCSI